jgi:hypothetical protein
MLCVEKLRSGLIVFWGREIFMSRYQFIKNKALVEIRKNDRLYRVVKKILGKNKKSSKVIDLQAMTIIGASGAVHADAAVVAVTEKRDVVSAQAVAKSDIQRQSFEDFNYLFKLKNYRDAIVLADGFDYELLSIKQKLDLVQCMLSADRGVDGDILLDLLLKEVGAESATLPYLAAIADKVFLSGYAHSKKLSIINRLKDFCTDDQRGWKHKRHLNWLEFRLHNEKESGVDPYSFFEKDKKDLAALKDNARFLSALKASGHESAVRDLLLDLYSAVGFSDLFTLRSFLAFWPDWFEGKDVVSLIPDKFKSELSLLIALSGVQKESADFYELYKECLDYQEQRYWRATVFEKDTILRTLLRLDMLELVQRLVFADQLPVEVLPAYTARGFKYFDEDDYYSSRACFIRVLEQDPSDGLASSGLRLAYPRTGHDMRAILGFRDRVGYGIKSAGRPGIMPIGSELTIAELMSGNYVAGLYSKRVAKHWMKMESLYSGRFLNFKPIPTLGAESKSIFVIGDEGVGDEIRTAQFYGWLCERFGSVTISCDPRLINIFSVSFPKVKFIPVRRFRKGVAEPGVEEAPRLNGIDEKIASYLTEECRQHMESADFITFGQNLFFNHFSGHLPRPASGAYLKWPSGEERRNTASKSLRVGLLWRSHFKSRMRDFMYLSLEELLPITKVANVEAWSVQHCIDEEEVSICNEYGIKLIEDVDLFNDFEGLSSCLSSMDLIVGISSVPIELAAALGVDVWMLGFSPENYYLRTAGGRDAKDTYTLNSTIIAPPWINFSEPRHVCVEGVLEDVCNKLKEKLNFLSGQ